MLKITLTICTLLLIGCARPMITSTFIESEYNYINKSGTATIAGQAFVKTLDGNVKKAAGNTVLLYPVTDYTTEIIDIARFDRVQPGNLNTKLLQYTRQTTADADGNFQFSNLPAGSFYISCPIYWQAQNGYSISTQGATVRQQATVKDGEFLKIVVSHE